MTVSHRDTERQTDRHTDRHRELDVPFGPRGTLSLALSVDGNVSCHQLAGHSQVLQHSTLTLSPPRLWAYTVVKVGRNAAELSYEAEKNCLRPFRGLLLLLILTERCSVSCAQKFETSTLIWTLNTKPIIPCSQYTAFFTIILFEFQFQMLTFSGLVLHREVTLAGKNRKIFGVLRLTAPLLRRLRLLLHKSTFSNH